MPKAKHQNLWPGSHLCTAGPSSPALFTYRIPSLPPQRCQPQVPSSHCIWDHTQDPLVVGVWCSSSGTGESPCGPVKTSFVGREEWLYLAAMAHSNRESFQEERRKTLSLSNGRNSKLYSAFAFSIALSIALQSLRFCSLEVSFCLLSSPVTSELGIVFPLWRLHTVFSSCPNGTFRLIYKHRPFSIQACDGFGSTILLKAH